MISFSRLYFKCSNFKILLCFQTSFPLSVLKLKTLVLRHNLTVLLRSTRSARYFHLSEFLQTQFLLRLPHPNLDDSLQKAELSMQFLPFGQCLYKDNGHLTDFSLHFPYLFHTPFSFLHHRDSHTSLHRNLK